MFPDLCLIVLQECTALPGFFPVDENHSDLAFGFWYNLQVNSSYKSLRLSIRQLLIARVAAYEALSRVAEL